MQRWTQTFWKGDTKQKYDPEILKGWAQLKKSLTLLDKSKIWKKLPQKGERGTGPQVPPLNPPPAM